MSDRPSGWYWVRMTSFPDEWRVAAWDAEAKLFAVYGGFVYPNQMTEIGPRIPEPSQLAAMQKLWDAVGADQFDIWAMDSEGRFNRIERTELRRIAAIRRGK